MAKKKKETELEDEDFGDFDDMDIEIAIPSMGEGEEGVAAEGEEGEEALEEEWELPVEDEGPDYKYLSLKLKRGKKENDYELDVLGQSHGFLNVMVRNLLEIEGVNMAAYKIDKLRPPRIFIRLEDEKYQIKEILLEGIENLRDEVSEAKKVFKELM